MFILLISRFSSFLYLSFGSMFPSSCSLLFLATCFFLRPSGLKKVMCVWCAKCVDAPHFHRDDAPSPSPTPINSWLTIQAPHHPHLLYSVTFPSSQSSPSFITHPSHHHLFSFHLKHSLSSFITHGNITTIVCVCVLPEIIFCAWRPWNLRNVRVCHCLTLPKPKEHAPKSQ